MRTGFPVTAELALLRVSAFFGRDHISVDILLKAMFDRVAITLVTRTKMKLKICYPSLTSVRSMLVVLLKRRVALSYPTYPVSNSSFTRVFVFAKYASKLFVRFLCGLISLY